MTTNNKQIVLQNPNKISTTNAMYNDIRCV